MQELKVRIQNYQKTEEKLKSLGAVFIEEISFEDTYFNAPKEHVNKISEASDGNFHIQLQENDNGGFNETKNEKINDVKILKDQLTKMSGINKILKGKRRRFKLNDNNISINLIDNIGEFLILYTQNPEKEFITNILNIENPEYITVPFNEL